jgi:hypothetical protein
MEAEEKVKDEDVKKEPETKNVPDVIFEIFEVMANNHRKSDVNHDVTAICEAIREQAFLSSYRKFDILVQKKPKEGRDYKYVFNDHPVVFIRYLEDDEYKAVNFSKDDSRRMSNCNGIIASGVFPNGSVQFFPVELGFFERAVEKPEGC